MKIHYSDKFRENVEKLPQDIKKLLRNKLEIMIDNPRHPSLRSKKIQGQENIFEASVTMGIRITWQYTDDGILLRNIGDHDKTLKDA
jgi:mRNA interferase RelE/StbE